MTRVLLVEDDTGVRNMNAFALSHSGFDVTLAESGAEAMRKMDDQPENAPFDVILLDMLMMGMSGLDFLREYDVKKKSPKTKVIALTNFDSEQIHDKAKALGVDEYLDKSRYEPQELVKYLGSLGY
jgi:CheY-like chemotaxis protein